VASPSGGFSEPVGRPMIYTKHARQRMRQRNISEGAVEHVTQNASTTFHRPDGCVEYTGEYGGRQLVVVIDERRNPRKLVVTTFWD
jgi:uncharacterized protein DUF4258